MDNGFDGARSVAATDVDGDGDLDILGGRVATPDLTHNTYEIAWWENDGTPGEGTWSKKSVDLNDVSVDYSTIVVAAADVDGDGDMDILNLLDGESAIYWWENLMGDGSGWQKGTVATDFLGAYDVAVVDMDKDGDLDVLGGAGPEVVWWNDVYGDQRVWAKHSVDNSLAGARSVVAADVDGDGDPDVLVVSISLEAIFWWENVSGDGITWTMHSVADYYPGVRDVAAADVDGDGDLDVLGAAEDDDEIVWWENVNQGSEVGDGSAWSKHSVASGFDGVVSIDAADVDGDGDLDVFGAARQANEIAWWENETLHRSALFPSGGKTVVDESLDIARSVTAADMNGDGDVDILGAAVGGNDITWWKNPAGDGSAWGKHTVFRSLYAARNVVAADLDGDGDLDILGGDGRHTHKILWCENITGDGSNWSVGQVVTENFHGSENVTAADLDGDGDLDVLGTSKGISGNQMRWWENSGGDASHWTEHAISSIIDGWFTMVATDLDGDGDLDVLGAAAGDTGIVWWENDGTPGDGEWIEHSVDDDFAAVDVASVDVNGDGFMDVLGASQAHSEIAWWRNTAGDGSAWTKHSLDSNFSMAQSVVAADLDVDGDLDILSASLQDDGIAWWENVNPAGSGVADGSTWRKHVVTKGEFLSFADVDAADLDGDGDVDIFGLRAELNEIAWWENLGGQFALATTDTAPTHLASGETDDLLKIIMTHNGRSGDGDEELATLELLFEESEGDPLTSAEANAVIGELDIYLDDGSGDLEIGSDILVTTVDTLALSDGVETVILPDGDASVQVQYGTPRTYFVVVQLVADAYTQTAIDQFRITHITESSSTADDRDYDIPLILEYATNVSSSEVPVPRMHASGMAAGRQKTGRKQPTGSTIHSLSILTMASISTTLRPRMPSSTLLSIAAWQLSSSLPATLAKLARRSI